jgi:ABC-type amino acid transport system permease subunit
MNPNPENELEARIDRELKSLSPLASPPSLAPRIMAAIAEQERAPWYRNGWQAWPLALRASSLVVLLALFAGLCFGGVKLSESKGVTAASGKVSGAFSLLSVAGKTLAALADAAVEVVRHVGTGYVVAAFAVIALAYAACVAFGSFYLRFAFSRR